MRGDSEDGFEFGSTDGGSNFGWLKILIIFNNRKTWKSLGNEFNKLTSTLANVIKYQSC